MKQKDFHKQVNIGFSLLELLMVLSCAGFYVVLFFLFEMPVQKKWWQQDLFLCPWSVFFTYPDRQFFCF